MPAGKRPLFETFEIDPTTNRLVITKQEEIDIKDTETMKQVETELVKKLHKTVGQIKALKSQAKEVRELLMKIRGQI